MDNYKVLIVDDNPVFINTLGVLIRTILGSRLLMLDVAFDGKEAVEKALGDTRYEYIFMDVNMPRMDGITASRIINNLLYRETRIVAVSFNKDLKTVQSMIEAGAYTYISKDNLTLDSLEKVFNINPS